MSPAPSPQSRVVARQVEIAQIPAPTGDEGARGMYVARGFLALGLADVHTDAVGNIMGTRTGSSAGAPLIICSHIDTIFPEGTNVSVTREGERIYGPGIVDNARGVAAMLMLAETIIEPRRSIMFVGTVGEEGSGDLRGVKHLFANLASGAHACIAIDGAGDERIVHRALGARRFRITFRGTGGHSWSSFGEPNPVHAAGAAAAKLASLPLPRTPKTTLSVNRIGGGISINAIPREAFIEVDLRSSSADALTKGSAEIELAVRAAVREENARRSTRSDKLTYTSEIIGDRPCGETSDQHPIVIAAMQATRDIGREPVLTLSSTDANVPISVGIPAIAIGAGGRGGCTHTTSEWFDDAEGHLGLARAEAIVRGAST